MLIACDTALAFLIQVCVLIQQPTAAVAKVFTILLRYRRMFN